MTEVLRLHAAPEAPAEGMSDPRFHLKSLISADWNGCGGDPA